MSMAIGLQLALLTSVTNNEYLGYDLHHCFTFLFCILTTGMQETRSLTPFWLLAPRTTPRSRKNAKRRTQTLPRTASLAQVCKYSAQLRAPKACEDKKMTHPNLSQQALVRSYASDASRLISSIRSKVSLLLEHRKQFLPSCIFDLDRVLESCQSLVDIYQAQCNDSATLPSQVVRSYSPWGDSTASAHLTSSTTNSKRSMQDETDSLIFHLVVTLQLCQLRVEDAYAILGRNLGTKVAAAASATDYGTNHHEMADGVSTLPPSTECDQGRSHGTSCQIARLALAGVGLATSVVWAAKDINSEGATRTHDRVGKGRQEQIVFVQKAVKVSVAALGACVTRRWWMKLCMKARIAESASTLTVWQQKWILLQCCSAADVSDIDQAAADLNVCKTKRNGRLAPKKSISDTAMNRKLDIINASSRRLLECLPLENPNKSFWHSQGAFRFLLLKRAMDLLYASVGTAIEVTGGPENSSAVMWMPVAAAVASYYTLTGSDTSHRATELLSAPFKSDLVSRSWGMMSQPSIKWFSLEISKLLKGAAIAERVVISGTPCFIICSNPFPALSSTLKRHRRRSQRNLSTLSTIHETASEDQEKVQRDDECILPHRKNICGKQYPTRDIIFHISGGGFFAHTIAGDLPYLIDWSSATDAVVVCPEYALLPDNCFPVAINQIAEIYCSLVRGDASPCLGFHTDKIIVTGESAGGNLAAALCVKLCTSQLVNKNGTEERVQYGDSWTEAEKNSCCTMHGTSYSKGKSCAPKPHHEHQNQCIFERLPDGLMLGCPALDLSLNSSPSRIMGNDDPVLPRWLLSTISDAYLPKHLGVQKDNPLASPYYASDQVLALFPPTRLYASSSDPLLDDSVAFNTRLRRLGVDTHLCAVHNMPHAYWGLSTAGFPEAKQVQSECKAWLVHQLKSEVKEDMISLVTDA